LERALQQGRPGIFNTDQGSQFTSRRFTDLLKNAAVSISMDGRGRALDNIFVERLWRSVKYECVYLQEWQSPVDAKAGLRDYFRFYNEQRPHQSLGYQTPAQVYASRLIDEN
jgi:putative transposase